MMDWFSCDCAFGTEANNPCTDSVRNTTFSGFFNDKQKEVCHVYLQHKLVIGW